MTRPAPEVTLAVTVGDPAGIGPEIALKAVPTASEYARLVLVGSHAVLEAQARHFGLTDALDRVEVHDVPYPAPDAWRFGEVSAACGEASAKYLEAAAALVKAGRADGIVTAPLHKEAWKAAGVPYPGHTEALGALFGAHVETMFVVDRLRIFFLTRHVSLKRAIELITKERLVELLEHVQATLRTYGIADPTIAVAALNPHGGEHGLFGDEEMTELEPGVRLAQERGIRAVGPVPADSVFHQGVEGRFDAVISLYHDQGHIASKMYDFYRTVSVTTGLPKVRSSVDHGTAFDIAGQGIANPGSMVEAVRVGAELALGALARGR
ncbi:4-hydroxythreonine-4-phosphate dehydrogenase PdxA [Deinococcus pimensis]|uniref:4-hydroxythreonine-4-phosphate dehydrogenase PdxA n=1 Tax=Deinococcus pimensis TaxID=309888 RepID=UPI0004802390|nr:4-hydroxythreonine-4-phosphate dehydrogenase PdxA [Deinococcus pimensis]